MILRKGPKVEQFKLIGYTLYKYIWKKKSSHSIDLDFFQYFSHSTERVKIHNYWHLVVNFLPMYSQKRPHSSLIRSRYVVFNIWPKFYLCSFHTGFNRELYSTPLYSWSQGIGFCHHYIPIIFTMFASKMLNNSKVISRWSNSAYKCLTTLLKHFAVKGHPQRRSHHHCQEGYIYSFCSEANSANAE